MWWPKLCVLFKNSLKAPAFIITQGNFVQISLISNETKRPLNAKRNFLLEIQPSDGKFRNILEVEFDIIHLRILYHYLCLWIILERPGIGPSRKSPISLPPKITSTHKLISEISDESQGRHKHLKFKFADLNIYINSSFVISSEK